jgi:hypothetical protein
MAGYLGHKPKLNNYTVDEFTTSAAQASSGNFTLSQTVTDSKTLEVSVGGIDQPQSAYSVSGTTLAFGASIVAENDIVIARHAGESIMYPALEDGAVTSAKIGAGAVIDAKISGMTSTKLTGTIDGARFPATLPATSGANLTALPAANITGVIPAANLGTGTASSTTFLNGAGAYAAAGGGAWTVIGSSVASGSPATLSVTGLDLTYDTYYIIGEMLGPTSASHAWLRFGDSGGIDTGGSDYAYQLFVQEIGGTGYNATSSSSADRMYMTAGNGINSTTGFACFLHANKGSSAYTHKPMVKGESYYISTGQKSAYFTGWRLAAMAVTEIQFGFGSGDIAYGRLSVWGIKHT